MRNSLTFPSVSGEQRRSTAADSSPELHYLSRSGAIAHCPTLWLLSIQTGVKVIRRHHHHGVLNVNKAEEKYLKYHLYHHLVLFMSFYLFTFTYLIIYYSFTLSDKTQNFVRSFVRT